LPLISGRLEGSSARVMLWFADGFGISATDQTVFFQRFTTNPENSVAKITTSIFSTTVATLVVMLLTPVFSALFLYHRGTFVRFLESIVSRE
jgi:predicted PurR-regulated permease PerM